MSKMHVPAWLEEIWQQGRARWPDVDVPLPAFAAHLTRTGTSLTDGSPPPSLHVSDVYLACACAVGDPPALALFEQHYLPEVDTVARTFASRGVSLDDVRQAVRERLFLPASGAKITQYRGQGDLRSWVRVVATRVGLNLVARPVHESPFAGDELAFLVGEGNDPELAYMRRTYAQMFKKAFRVAFDQLEDRQRNVIRHAFAQSLSVDAIGQIYGVHRSTAARWVVEAHAALALHVRRHLTEHLGIAHKDYQSLVRWMKSHLEISLGGYLENKPG